MSAGREEALLSAAEKAATGCTRSPSGKHEWVDDERIGEGECLWCMARSQIGRFGRALKAPNRRNRGA